MITHLLRLLAHRFDNSVKLSMDQAELKELKQKKCRTQADMDRIRELEQSNTVKIK